MWYSTIGQLDSDLPFYLFGAASGIVFFLSLVNILIGCWVPGSPPGSSMDFYVGLGSMLLCLTVLIRGVTPEWADNDQFNTMCELFPACLLVGLTMVIGGLMVKGWANFSYSRWKLGMKLPISQEWKPSLWMWLLLIVTGLVVVVWAVQYDSYIDIKHTAMTCVWEREFEWQVATSVWHAFLLVLALLSVLANCSRKESCALGSDTSVVIMNTVGGVVAGLCVHFAADPSPTVYYAVTSALLIWVCLFANVVFIVVRLTSNKKSMLGGEESYDTLTESTLGQTLGRDDELVLEERSSKRHETFNY